MLVPLSVTGLLTPASLDARKMKVSFTSGVQVRLEELLNLCKTSVTPKANYASSSVLFLVTLNLWCLQFYLDFKKRVGFMMTQLAIKWTRNSVV